MNMMFYYKKGWYTFMMLEDTQNHCLNCHFLSVIFVQRGAARQGICDFMCSQKTSTWGKPIFSSIWTMTENQGFCWVSSHEWHWEHLRALEDLFEVFFCCCLLACFCLNLHHSHECLFLTFDSGYFLSVYFTHVPVSAISQMKLKASTSKVTETQIWFILWLELFLGLLQPAAGES